MKLEASAWALMAAAIANPVYAQETPATAPKTAADTADIVVTAQKRSERLTDVPISITAISGQALTEAGVRSMADLTTVTPGLYFATNGAFAQPVVRGVSSSVTGAGADANVAIYIDGVYQPSQIGNFSDLLDVEQIEVLKGPQGTLFGRNATGGAISITTRKPSFTPTAEMNVSYGSFNDARLSATASAGLSKTIAASFSFIVGGDDGYTRNITTGNNVSNYKTTALRGKLLWEPSNGISFLLTGDHSDRKDNSAFALQPLNGNNSNLKLAGAVAVTNPRQVALTFDPQINTVTSGVSLRSQFDLGFASLTSISSWRTRESYVLTDSDRTNLALLKVELNDNQKTWTQEFNLVSPSRGAFRWFAGFFYYNDDATLGQIVNGGVPTVNNIKTIAYAPFGEATLEFAPGLTAIAGIRYNVEEKKYVGVRGATTIGARQTFRNTTPRLGLRYALTDHSNLYATWSRGFKSGLYDTSSFTTTIVLPEQLDAFEVGYKYGHGSTSFNIAGYYYKYKNIQFQALNPANTGSIVFNAAAAEIYGADVDFSIRPVTGLTLRGGLAYSHGRYQDFSKGLIYQPLAGGGNALVGLGQANPVTGVINTNGASGQPLTRMPEFSANASANYEQPLAGGSTLQFNTNAYYSGRFAWTPQNRLQQKPYVIINGEIAWVSPGKQFRLSLWGKNLADETYGIYVVDATAGDAAAYGRPRTFGGTATVKF